MRLAHLSLTSNLTPYTHGLFLQSHLVQRHVTYKNLLIQGHPQSLLPPDPTIITLQHIPTYTVGRRDLSTYTASQIDFLTNSTHRATFYESPRGGQITFHGPGQFLAYPILDLRRHKLSPRCYIRLLEKVTIATMRRVGVVGLVTGDPGVWLPGGEKKVASVGVNVRRGVTGHGVAVNVEDRKGELSWGFGRIVACGLEGKEVTWLEKEGGRGLGGESGTLEVQEVEKIWVEEFVRQLGGVDECYEIGEEDLANG